MNWMFPRTGHGLVSTRWTGDNIVVMRDNEVIDCLRSNDIERVMLVHAGEGESPGDVRAALFDLADRVVLLGAASGVAARVLFERQAFWSRRSRIYWVAERSVAWTSVLGKGRWPLRARVPPYEAITHAATGALLEHAQVTGPHTWDERKRYRIERRRPFRGHAIGAPPLHSGLPT
jgi:hypothetical protein